MVIQFSITSESGEQFPFPVPVLTDREADCILQSEICDVFDRYLKCVLDAEELFPRLRLEVETLRMMWSDSDEEWTVSVTEIDDIHFDFEELSDLKAS